MRIGAKLVALALGCAAPAAAQDLVFDTGGTLSCIETAPGDGRTCIGRSAEACMKATPGGYSTVGMGGCLDRELSFWDDRLNEVYRALRADERAEDEERSGEFGYVSRAEALRDMQRAWIAWRDATCDYERAQWGGGTGGGPATAGCLMRLTGEQALYLARMRGSY